jgi:hypothetical protein
VYGIRSLAVRAPRLRSVVEDCALAAKSADARDKYFETYVGGAAPGASKALRSELPSLEVRLLCICSESVYVCVGFVIEAARASVATVVAELAQVLPQISSCRGAASSFVKIAGCHAFECRLPTCRVYLLFLHARLFPQL